MSRIGKQILQIPANTTVVVENNEAVTTWKVIARDRAINV